MHHMSAAIKASVNQEENLSIRCHIAITEDKSTFLILSQKLSSTEWHFDWEITVMWVIHMHVWDVQNRSCWTA